MSAKWEFYTREVGRFAARSGTVLAALALALPLLAACGQDDDGTTLRVLAAASLNDVFTELAEEFESAHDGVDVELSFGSSTDLAEQAADGAPADVLATADRPSIERAVDAGVAVGPTGFADNRLVLVTPPDNPAQVASVADLDGSTWIRCADEVPCGRAAVRLLSGVGLSSEPASLEEDVRSALDKVTAGEADAALVYHSDAVAAGNDVRSIPIRGADRFANRYYVASLRQSGDADLAADFLELLHSPEAVEALVRWGFWPPEPPTDGP